MVAAAGPAGRGRRMGVAERGAELAAEAMMQLSLPELKSTNGSWLAQQATHNIIRSMITKHDTWHPRYGVNPGYGINMQDGFQDTFTTTVSLTVFTEICYIHTGTCRELSN